MASLHLPSALPPAAPASITGATECDSVNTTAGPCACDETFAVKDAGQGLSAARIPFAALGIPGLVTAVPGFETAEFAVVARAGGDHWTALEQAVR